MPRLLLVDDEPNILRSVGDALAREGYTVTTAADAATGRSHLTEPFDCALLDVWLPDGSGLDLLTELLATQPACVAVMISGHAELSDAVKATRTGAFDFLEKPLSLEKVLVTLANGLELERLRRENLRLRQDEDTRYRILGRSQAVTELLTVIQKVAASDARVLILGENGSGKELVARQIHRQSARAAGPFVPLNCAALPENLIESELFGFEKGAFTGAVRTQPGKFEQADGGTLFLDEVGDLPPAAQAKLLRVLEEGRVRRLGAAHERVVDVRVVAATNRDLVALVAERKFREDLRYRLNVIPITVPPLRERPDDIELLSDHFLQWAAGAGRPKRLSDSALKLLRAYAFPGNVRELRNIAERAAILVEGSTIEASHLKKLFPELAAGSSTPSAPYAEQIKEAERRIVQEALEHAGWNVSQAAAALGLERSHLHKKMKALGLERPE
jgi:two-component system nitrogen regulation response regulator NtrX